MDLIKELNKEALQKETANVQVGDTVRVHVGVKGKVPASVFRCSRALSPPRSTAGIEEKPSPSAAFPTALA